MKVTPAQAVIGILLLFALSFLVQLAIAKWRYERRQAEARRAAAEGRGRRPDDRAS
jgi:hypothetical protein